MSFDPGTRLGPYEILALIGAGGMGKVYRARDHRLGRDVAVKIVATDRPGDAGLLARLEQEARTAASLSHPNIVAVFGRWEVYVKPYPGPGARRQISTGGGAEVVWARNGRELFYRIGTKLMGVDIQTTPAFSTGTPHVVVDGTFAPGQPGLPGYDVSMDGQRFLMVKPGDGEAAQRPIHVVINWFEELRRLAAAAR